MLALFLALAMVACKKRNHPENETVKPPIQAEAPYQLTLVYFVPSDLKANPDYKRRISEYLRYEQNYIKQWMKKWGYGEKTFALPIDKDGMVEINVIYGQQPNSAYPYEGGASPMSKEILAWFAAHPTQKKSEHVFVLTAVNEFGKQNAPFYGTGKWAYGVDFPYMEIANMDKAGAIGEQSAWIGGNFHEMLHALNLPHNGGQVSNNQLYGLNIMASNGSYFVTGKTYLDAFDCAILSVGQTFSQSTRNDWYKPANSAIKKLNAQYDKASNSIVLSGRFASGKEVKYIGFTNDPPGSSNYNTQNWATAPIGLDSFYVKMPVSEIQPLTGIHDIYIRFIHINGTIEYYGYGYEMVNSLPDIQFGDEKGYDKAKWKVTDFSSEEAGDGKASFLIDGNTSTLWHSKWRGEGSKLPQHFTVDMGEKLPVKRLSFHQRAGHSQMLDIEISTSNDYINWTSQGSYKLLGFAGPNKIKLPAETSFRYFRVKVNSSKENTGFATCNEVSAHKD